MSQIDLSTYPAPQVLEALSYEAIFGEIKTHFLSQFPTSEQEAAEKDMPTRAKAELLMAIEGNLIVKALQAYAYHAIQMRARVNDAAKATMLAYAAGTDLDNLAAFYMVTRKAGESDSDLRARLILAVDGFSTAGPAGAYRFHALSANDDVKDVHVGSTQPGEVKVTILSRQGDGTPTQQVLDDVSAALNGEYVRPLTDSVVVQAATITDYTISAQIWCYPGFDGEVIRQAAEASAQAYADEMHKLGHDITDSALKDAIHQPGVQRVVVASPAAPIAIGDTAAAHCSAVAVTYEGTDV